MKFYFVTRVPPATYTVRIPPVYRCCTGTIIISYKFSFSLLVILSIHITHPDRTLTGFIVVVIIFNYSSSCTVINDSAPTTLISYPMTYWQLHIKIEGKKYEQKLVSEKRQNVFLSLNTVFTLKFTYMWRWIKWKRNNLFHEKRMCTPTDNGIGTVSIVKSCKSDTGTHGNNVINHSTEQSNSTPHSLFLPQYGGGRRTEQSLPLWWKLAHSCLSHTGLSSHCPCHGQGSVPLSSYRTPRAWERSPSEQLVLCPRSRESQTTV